MTDTLRDDVRRHYARAALAVLEPGCRGPDAAASPGDPVFGPGLYDPEQLRPLPADAVAASLGCGNPTAVAELRPGEVVLDLGSGGGIDVLLSAQRVGPAGIAYGLDMTDEMLELARRNKVELPYADLDLSESYFTYLEGGGTGFRPWHDSARPWESVKTPMQNLVAPVLRAFPRVRMVHVNYAAGEAPRVARARRYSLACARLFSQEAYTIVPGLPAAEEDDYYASDLGRPVSRLEEDLAQGIAWREFERGVVAVNGSARPARLRPLGLVLTDPFQGYVFRKGA